MSQYILEVAVIHISLVAGYFLLLREEQQYTMMRFYLIGATLLSLLIPLLHIPIPDIGTIGNTPMNVVISDPALVQTSSIETVYATDGSGLSFWNFMDMVYLIISGLLLLNFTRNILYLLRLKSSSLIGDSRYPNIRKSDRVKGSFTFFNWIFLNDKIDDCPQTHDVILKHEKAHLALGHSYDLIFFELFKIIFWFIPTAWFIIPEIKKIHEYEADAEVLKSYPLNQYSTILINATLKSNGLTLTSSLHDGFILKRIKTMKQKTVSVKSWKLGLLTTLMVSLFLVFACSQEPKSDMEVEVFTVVEEQPEFVGGMDAFYNYIRQEIRYPLEARQSGVEGSVQVQFVVERDGSLSEVRAIDGIGSGCDREAERVIANAPAFKPGKQRGKAIRVKMAMPIVFKLDHGRKNPDNSTQGMIVVKEVEMKKGKLKIDASFRNGKWSGTVYDENGGELPGANIVVAGTTTGTVSDLDGTFTVKADASNELLVSFVGYETVVLGSK